MKNIFDQQKLEHYLTQFLENGRAYFQETQGLKFLEAVINYLLQATEIEPDKLVKSVACISEKGGDIAMTTTITVRQVVKIHNRQLYLMLPEGFDYEEVEVIVMPASQPNDHISFWDSSDIDMAGKIGQSSASFPEDDEDYSTW